jgi:hypothetical protein
VLADQQPDKVLVKMTDGSELVLERPVVSGDTLTGFQQGEPRSIPLDDVSALEVRKGDVLLTVGVVLGALVLMTAVAAGVCAASDCLQIY